ncbi:MAG: Y4yA family PLP-dependent enzyme [Candidatus Obscuribacterales bacterium]|nr:Y4yA family PLP-dependent enzyme [Candidatus Obscuribacterales bacterium]
MPSSLSPEKETVKASTSSEAPLTLTPKVHPVIAGYLKEKAQLFELTKALGSPLNFLFPELVHENVEAFRSAFAQFGIQGKVFFAHKCNQSESIIRRLSVENAGLDISSANELRHALGSGFDGSRLEATGPKNPEFLGLCVQQGVTINLDSIAELKQVIALRKLLHAAKPTKVLLRLSGFEADHSKFLNKGSRFGIPLKDLPQAFAILDEWREDVILHGFAFHLDTVSVVERAVAIENCIQIFEDALAQDFDPRVLNIGGGYKVNYLASEDDWNAYTSALKEAVLGTRPPMTWQGNSFGLHTDKGKLRGNFNSYNYYDEQTGPKFLAELLSHRFPNLGDMTAGSILRDNMIELWIEPGRSLVDQTGITVARVNSLRTSSRGETIVCLNMKRQDISFLDQEIFVDPVVIYHEEDKEAKPGSVPVYFAGNLCLESDLIYRHLTYLPQMPQPGDLVAFINTAGYFMDFSATNSIMQPIGRKVSICERDGKYNWSLDDQYVPFWDATT